MKKLILIGILFLCLSSCKPIPILDKEEFTVVEILHITRNGFNDILGYDVIIRYNNEYHAGKINTDSQLIYYNPRVIKLP